MPILHDGIFGTTVVCIYPILIFSSGMKQWRRRMKPFSSASLANWNIHWPNGRPPPRLTRGPLPPSRSPKGRSLSLWPTQEARTTLPDRTEMPTATLEGPPTQANSHQAKKKRRATWQSLLCLQWRYWVVPVRPQFTLSVQSFGSVPQAPRCWLGCYNTTLVLHPHSRTRLRSKSHKRTFWQ